MAACVLVVLAAGCGSGAKQPNPLDPHAYLEHALGLMRSRAVYTPAGGWDVVTAHAKQMAASAKSPADTYPALEYVIDRLRRAGDRWHAIFMNPQSSRLEGKLNESASPGSPPTVSLAAPRVGLVTLPAISSSPSSPDGRRYARSALSAIVALRHRSDICGWVIDVRGDEGGDLSTMLLAVGPILGSGRVIGFTGKGKPTAWVTYRAETLSGLGQHPSAPIDVRDFTPTPAVAVLTGPNTVSAGEAVAIGFHGRPNTRSFGGTSGGATNSPVS